MAGGNSGNFGTHASRDGRTDRTGQAGPAGGPGRWEGSLDARGKRFAIVAARFNEFVVDRLISGAQETLVRLGADPAGISVARVPGSFEIPPVARRLAKTHRFDAVICLGAVIRGETPHFDYVAAEAARGVAEVARKEDVPVIFGILTTDTVEQAVDRAGAKAGNKGSEAAMAAVEMSNLYAELPGRADGDDEHEERSAVKDGGRRRTLLRASDQGRLPRPRRKRRR